MNIFFFSKLFIIILTLFTEYIQRPLINLSTKIFNHTNNSNTIVDYYQKLGIFNIKKYDDNLKTYNDNDNDDNLKTDYDNNENSDNLKTLDNDDNHLKTLDNEENSTENDTETDDDIDNLEIKDDKEYSKIVDKLLNNGYSGYNVMKTKKIIIDENLD